MGALIDYGVAARPLLGQNESGDRHLVRPHPNGVLVAVMDGLGHGEAAAVAARIAVATLETHAEESVIRLLQRCHEALKGTRGVVMSLASFDILTGTMTWVGVGNVEGLLLRASWPGRTAANVGELKTHALGSIPLPTGESRRRGGLRWGRPKKGRASSFERPHPSLPPWGEGVTNAGVEPNSTELRAEVPRQAREALLLRGGVVGYQLPPLHASSLSVTPGDLLLFATDGIRSGFTEELRPRGLASPQALDTPQQIADHILARFGKDTDDALVLVARYGGTGS